jgi:serine/threonine protein phosphatase PrpC
METQKAPSLPAIEYAERSDPGRDPEKQVNEDVAARRETSLGHLCVVCDGMGGHASGREAAELAVAVIIDTFDRAPFGARPPEVLLLAIEQANRAVYAMPTNEVAAGRPGCTVVAALLHAAGTEIAHVGDSRGYLVHEGQIFRVTRDHSIVQELVERGLLTPQQAAHHPDANRITRALGIAPEVQAEVRPTPIPHVAGDAFVLCSDGLSDLVEEHEILAIVGSEPAAQAVGKLVDLANARGGHDNITVVVLRARESAAVQTAGVAPTVAQTSVPATRTVEAPAPPPGVFEPPPAVAPMAHPANVAPLMHPANVAPLMHPANVAPMAHPPNAAHPANVGGARSMRPLEPAPPSPRAAPGVRPATAIVAVGLVLACVAAALLGVMLVIHLSERSGKRNSHDEPAPLAIDAGTNARLVNGTPTTLAPESVVVPERPPPAAEPIVPLAPLEPTPGDGNNGSGNAKRRKHAP